MPSIYTYSFTSKMEGEIRYTECIVQEPCSLHGQFTLIYIKEGSAKAEIDGIATELTQGDLLTFSHLQHLSIYAPEEGKIPLHYISLCFDDHFYCIFGQDHEVSCRGLLFNGSSYIPHIKTSILEQERIEHILNEFKVEFNIHDRYQEEALRSRLRSYIILATRISRGHEHNGLAKEEELELVRQFINLLDEHYRSHKKVQDYAAMLHCSSRTLTNKVTLSGRGTPLKMIHDRITAEAIRRLLYTECSVKELADYLGFPSAATFSRFFRGAVGQSVSDYRRQHQQG